MPSASPQPTVIPIDTARSLAVIKQGLHRRLQSHDPQGLLNAVFRIGLVQLDSIHVVARSHYLVLLSRLGLYDPAELDRLLYPDRQLFEHWAHAACLIPCAHYGMFAPIIRARRTQSLGWLDRLGPDSQQVLEDVMATVRANGPVASKDFKDPRDKRGTWWDWKPAKMALEILFARGYLLVDRREGFQRYYDLAERVLPESSLDPTATVLDWHRWATLTSVRCLGVATARQVRDYYRQDGKAVRLALKDLVAQGAVIPVEVDGWTETAYMDTSDLRLAEEIAAGAHQPTLTTFLSPFDNLIWDRRRVHDLFGFDYRLEAYTPLATHQRKYGYYVMPILRRGRLVGRLDPKSDRRTRTLIVQAIHLEPDAPFTDDLVWDIAAALREFMAFHGCEALEIRNSNPDSLAGALLHSVNAAED
ncbi:MAG: winged helix-turn-helix domain-containing protein [Anaerolineales bacterium]|nr:winged helix-turn-helix domain-containing protein [Anaerolineales bacterium]